MRATDYKPIIRKVLTDGRKYNSVDHLVNTIVDKMEMFEELMPLAQTVLTQTAEAPTTGLVLPFVDPRRHQPVAAEEPAPPAFVAPIDLSQRVSATAAREYTEEQIMEMKQSVVSYLKTNLPEKLNLHLDGFTQPVTINRLQISSSPGAMTTVKFQYAPPNASSDQMIINVPLDVTGEVPTISKLVELVKEQAGALYLAQPRQVITRMPTPTMLIPGDPNALSAETDDERVNSNSLKADRAFWNQTVDYTSKATGFQNFVGSDD